MTWALSLGGRRPLLAPAILVLAAASAGALTVAVALVARSLGWTARAPWLILFAPGALLAVWNPGLTEVLATTLALAGFVAHRRGRAGWAVLLFSLAVLSRETTFLIPAALVAGDVITHRRWRSLSLVAVPAACYVAWSQVVQQLLGHTSGAGGARQLSLPGVGFVGAIPFWGPLELAGLLVVLVSAVVAWRSGDREVRLVVLAFVAFASVMGTIVWSEWWGFGRVFLPLAAFGVASFRTDDRGAGVCTATSETGAVPEVALNR